MVSHSLIRTWSALAKAHFWFCTFSCILMHFKFCSLVVQSFSINRTLGPYMASYEDAPPSLMYLSSPSLESLGYNFEQPHAFRS